ncbi:MAG: hypothetical protein HPY75_13030 [Actinobacteria bacterium]|nr:hypothetical protein [Actinomycetota bacterium]
MADESEGPEPRRLTLRVDADHCAETAAKREYARLAEEYLRGSGRLREEEYEYRLDLLRDFLKNTDFASLRAFCEKPLREAGLLSLVLFRNAEGRPEFTVLPGEVSCDRGKEAR